MTSYDSVQPTKAHKLLLDAEFAIFDNAPMRVRDAINEHGSPIRELLLIGANPNVISSYLEIWTDKILKKRNTFPAATCASCRVN